MGVWEITQGAYASWERSIKQLATEGNIEIKIEPVYRSGNMTTRPDAFRTFYRQEGQSDWVRNVFRNQAGG